MSLAQLHYTSAPQGPDGPDGPDSRFTAVTPGIPRSLLREAEPLLGYEPPHDAPEHPGPAELAAFPQAFSHTLLSDGTRLLARAVRTGANGGGPAGSHTHAVLLPGDAGLPGGGLPISAWNSSRWASAAPAGGSPAQLEALPPSGLLGREALVGFAASRGPWLPGFLASLRELTEEASGPRDGERAARIVLVERDSADVALWIALACAVLPRDRADLLTFTTYTRRPRDARQRIVGVLPGDAPEPDGRDHHCRVHDCTSPAPAPAEQTTTDVWAGIAARVWLGRAPELFTEAAALPGGVFSPGALAVVALCADLAPGPGGRAAAADWAHTHARALGDARLRRLVETFQAESDDRTTAEFAALTRLFTALPEDLGQRLAAGLAPELRAGVADSGPGITRPVELLRVADALGVDCTDLLPGLARRLARSLLADPETADTPDLLTVLEEHFELRTALLSALDAVAAEDPPAAVRLLGRTSLALTGVQALPHLRMCAGAPWTPAAAGGDGLAALHAALRACGVSPFTDPLVLRTAVRLVWDGGAPAPGEARRLLSETGSDAHRAAGTWRTLVRAALDSPADAPADTATGVDDADAATLAHDLLRCFPDELEPRVRGALLLLEFAGEIGAGRAGPPWTERVLALRAEAEPVEPAVLDRVFGTLTRRLLSEERPEGELYALIHCGEPELLTAYATAAQEERVRDRLRTAPAYAADCFIAWSSLPGANRAWDRTRTSLLDKVLRPAVRAFSDEDTASVERGLERAGLHRAEEFRAWNRPGALSRLSRRLGGLGRPR
ncbi:GTPase-associated protein 1-related protein [Streptomyces scopuliridis]|uniref:GTPase-associated protein 1-related protein n=1 Tax=Streptomyces scopuliridis TaxID=452529 RepID=UPI003679696A